MKEITLESLDNDCVVLVGIRKRGELFGSYGLQVFGSNVRYKSLFQIVY